ncbi:hypothetical protein INT47_004668 [Mucor saturninus]|uniref:SH3 domain-containing protein n=1 Tax=Mucor saturninus TaxID=64648 RepID=A0A8H7QG92_9FUNG|nr:hypothetical protein INT47_004668 [Mucor saturninus]
MGIKINSPLPSSLASECRKASRILNSFTDNGKGVDIMIPPHILYHAKGLAIFTVLKAGFLFSGRAGSGLVVAKLSDGSWSAPSAIMTGGMGFGGQVGAELTDFIMVLNTTSAVKTFMHHGSITLGGNISVAAGPVGRNAEASGTASLKSVAAVYSYSKTRGLFAGVSLEGSVIFERFDANKKMYGCKVKARDLLNGSIPPPPAASELYRALEVKTTMTGARDFNRFDESRSSFSTTDSQPRSFSRAAIHSMAKGGGSSALMSHGSDYDPPWPSESTESSLVLSRTEVPRARALFNFTGEQEGDLVFHKGDIITITKKTDTQNDWWTGKLNDREGIFPANFVQMVV